jgi:hypothetical protein
MQKPDCRPLLSVLCSVYAAAASPLFPEAAFLALRRLFFSFGGFGVLSETCP